MGVISHPTRPGDLPVPDPTPLKVLCVDDYPDTCESIAMLLTAHGLDARACRDGPSALALAGAFRPDACLVDLRMPGMDGYELARRLRALLGPGVLLVAVTGELHADRDRRAADAGFDRLFVKPPDPGDLLDALAR